MNWFIAGLASLGLVMWLVRAIAWAKPETLIKIGIWGLALAGTALLLFLLVTGRIGLLWTAGLFFLPLLRRALQFRAAWRFWRGLKGKSPGSRGKGRMTRTEALAVLGLKPGASRTEIVAAHRALMKNAHPDRGGSDWQAARLNEARDILLRADR